jgi:hypothetical protein
VLRSASLQFAIQGGWTIETRLVRMLEESLSPVTQWQKMPKLSISLLHA